MKTQQTQDSSGKCACQLRSHKAVAKASIYMEPRVKLRVSPKKGCRTVESRVCDLQGISWIPCPSQMDKALQLVFPPGFVNALHRSGSTPAPFSPNDSILRSPLK